MTAVAKQKGCEVIGQWEKSIINHLYWCVASTLDGDGDMMRDKWLSLDNHIHNVHRRHSKSFPKCQHGRLNRKWLKRRMSLCTLW